MHDTIELVSWTKGKQSVDVIGHDAPGDQCISISIEGQKRALNQIGNRRNCEIVPAMPLIESGIDGSDAVDAPRLCQFLSQSGRKAVRQSEDNMLNEVGAINMRKITARAPVGRRSARRQS